MTVRQIGHSANGNPIWVVEITAKWQSKAVKARNLKYRSLIGKEPAKAKQMLTVKSGIRAPVYINAGIHGNETTATDAALALIRKLAFSKDAETLRILKNCVVLINPCLNPDGRIADVRVNGNGFDLNRDAVSVTQPETVVYMKQVTKYSPVTFLDLHGHHSLMLLEPCTAPHNPNLEYDLYIKWAEPLAEYMKSTLEAETGYPATIPYQWGTAKDEYDNVNEYWEDYGAIYTGMNPGVVGQVFETISKTQDGVDAQYWVSWAMMNYVAGHRLAMLRDQAEYFRRGDENVPDSVTGRPWAGNMTEMLRPVPWGHPDFPYPNVVGDVTFPYAHILPVDPSLQKDPLQAYKFVNHARIFGIEVHVATKAFTAGTTSYPAGTFVVRTQQPNRAALSNLLWDGEDVKARYNVSEMYDIVAWSLPEQWGFDAYVADDPFAAKLARVTGKVAKTGTLAGSGPVFWFAGDSNQAVKTVNEMLARLYNVGMVHETLPAPNDGVPLGAFVVDTTDRPGALGYLKRTAKAYGVDFTTAEHLTLDLVAQLSTPTVSVAVDRQTLWVLTEVLGFRQASANAGTLGSSTTAYLTSQSSTSASATRTGFADVQTWLNGASALQQRTYIGVTGGASQAWAAELLPDVTVAKDPEDLDNGIVMARYGTDSIYTAGYPENDYAFCYPPYWFTEDSDAVSTDINYQAGITGPFHSGFWNNSNEDAVGAGAMVTGTYDGVAETDYNRVVLMGFHPTFRAMPENTYLLVARAILLSSATFPAEP